MIVAHVECGLGNQMLDYAELLAAQYANPKEDCYIEKTVFDIKECHGTISMWNGYELDRIFGIDAKDIKELFDEDSWAKILNSIRKSEFWEKNWSIGEAVCAALAKEGHFLENHNYSLVRSDNGIVNRLKKYIFDEFFHTKVGSKIKKNIAKYMVMVKKNKNQNELFPIARKDIYIGHTLKFMYRGYGIEKIEKELRQVFIFPELKEKQNIKLSNAIQKEESVAIHARRGDFLSQNRNCYENGYFKRAVGYIKSHVDSPKFYFFCDTDSIQWSKENLHIFGLDESEDEIYHVDWNTGEESYRDMQLMSLCKHNIITNSSFGWWGAFLNKNPNKITCSPDPRINTTHHF